MRKSTLLAFLFVSMLGLPGLVSGYPHRAVLESEMARLQAKLQKAQATDGPLCLPEALARAQSYLARAWEELEEGDYWEAEEYLILCKKDAKGILARILTCDRDVDRDGIPDRKDECLERPETYNAYRDDDGCPDRMPTLAMLTTDKIEILEPVRFDENSQQPLSASLPVIKTVASILEENPHISLRLEVHYDNSVPPDLAERLTLVRAQNLKDLLVELGIDKTRLRATGVGSRQPIASNLSPLGRKLNQRVEFVLEP